MKREDLYLRSFLENDELQTFIEGLGGNYDALMKEAGLPTSAPPGKIQFSRWNPVCRLFELCAAELNEPSFGLKWARAQPQDMRASGPMVFIGSISKNIRIFLDSAIAYQKIHSNGVSYSYIENNDKREVTVFLSIHPLSDPCRQLCEHILSSIAVMRDLYLPEFKFKHITFQHCQPLDMALYEDLFQCPVSFNCPQNTIVFDLALMKTENSSKTLKRMAPFLIQYFNSRVKKQPLSKGSTQLMVAEILPTVLGVNNSEMSQVASILKLHPKKLQRILKDEGTSYSSVLDDVRRSIAERLLYESDISIERLGKMLDYSSDRPFTTATKRWFGMTPTAYRNHVRKQ